jgi:uncharacterized protein YndB with AHSA1/START domain/DNA-binding transcriptional ArsR family regulator
VFKALADATRRQLLDSLNAANGQTLQELCVGLAMTRQSVSKHLAVLESAGLITTVRRSREKFHYLNAVPINEISERWINRYDATRVRALSDLKETLEMTQMEMNQMEKPHFVYTTYIRTTPERLWSALTRPGFTKLYWGLEYDTDWEKGSTFSVVIDDVVISHPEQVILQADPPRRLSYKWHTFTQEWADKYGFGPEYLATLAAEPRSTVTFDIEPAGDMVKLTVTHDGFEEGSSVLEGITQGWPLILSKMKTLLESS